MASSALRVASDFTLPLDAATRRLALLATSGAGKSNAAVVIAEQMSARSIPWYAIDPKGDWWGVRSGGDGNSAGLPVPIFGGLHGDIALEATAGKVVAETVAKQRLSCVIDVSQFEQRQQMYGFLADFATALLRINVEPLHGFLDECHTYIPQTARDKGQLPRCLGAWERLIGQGRNKGLGSSQISQRSALVNKNTLDIAECIIAMRTFSPRDRDAIEGWLGSRTDKATSKAILDSLPTLGNGKAWIYAPGESVTPPSRLADIDLAALGERMRETVARAKENDPKALRARIATLSRELAATKAAQPVVDERALAEAEQRVSEAETAEKYWRTVAMSSFESLSEMAGAAAEAAATIERTVEMGPEEPPAPPKPQAKVLPYKPRFVAPTPKPSTNGHEPGDYATLRAGARRMLEELVRAHPDGLTRAQLATLAGMSPKSGTFSTYLGELKHAGYFEESGGALIATGGALADVGPVDRPRTPDELLDMWSGRFRAGARRMLKIIVESGGISRDELAERAEMSAASGTFSTYLGELRRNGLVSMESGVIVPSELLVGAR